MSRAMIAVAFLAALACADSQVAAHAVGAATAANFSALADVLHDAAGESE